jgi:hypothetical protein
VRRTNLFQSLFFVGQTTTTTNSIGQNTAKASVIQVIHVASLDHDIPVVRTILSCIVSDYSLLQNSQHSPGLFHDANSLLSFHEERFISCKIGKGGHDVHHPRHLVWYRNLLVVGLSKNNTSTETVRTCAVVYLTISSILA